VVGPCLAEGSRLRLDVPEQKREELFFLIPKVDTLFVPEELHKVPGRRKPSRRISARGSTAQPHCLHESTVVAARERDQGGVALHSTTLGYGVVPARLEIPVEVGTEHHVTTERLKGQFEERLAARGARRSRRAC